MTHGPQVPDPERIRPRLELGTALDDLQAIVADLEVAAGSRRTGSSRGMAARWATRLHEMIGGFRDELEALGSRSVEEEAISS